MLSWDPRPNIVVDFLKIDATIKELIEYYDIKVFASDRWNSVHTIEGLGGRWHSTRRI